MEEQRLGVVSLSTFVNTVNPLLGWLCKIMKRAI